MEILNCYIICKYYHYFDESNKLHCTSNYNCPEPYNKLIIGKKKCIDICKNDDTYRYEYNNMCYKKCPFGSYLLEIDGYNCYDTNPDGYYLDIYNRICKKCYDTCEKCNIGGNKTNNNCLECKPNYSFYINNLNISNCYETCEYYYYFDGSNKFHCTNKYYCPEPYNKLIENKKKCTDDCRKDDTYIYEYKNTCIQEEFHSKITNDINKIKELYFNNTINNTNSTKDIKDSIM